MIYVLVLLVLGVIGWAAWIDPQMRGHLERWWARFETLRRRFRRWRRGPPGLPPLRFAIPAMRHAAEGSGASGEMSSAASRPLTDSQSVPLAPPLTDSQPVTPGPVPAVSTASGGAVLVSAPRTAPPTTRSLPTQRIGRQELYKLLAADQVTFVSANLMPCACSVRGRRAGWVRCMWPGNAAFVIHALDARGQERAVKIYVPGASRASVDTRSLAAVDHKLRRLAREGATCFAESVFLPEELVAEYETRGHRAKQKFPVAVMPWIGDRPYARLDRYAAAHLGRPRKLVAAARALREVWNECGRRRVAHGDLGAANVVIEDSAGDDASAWPAGVRAILLDADTLSWEGHTEVVRHVKGQPGFYTLGRGRSPELHAAACEDAVWMIDVPAQIIIYLSMLAYATEREPSRAPDGTLAFSESETIQVEALDARLAKLRVQFADRGPCPRALDRLMDDLRAHCAHDLGIDLRRWSPFLEDDVLHELALFEDAVARGPGPALREEPTP